MSERLALKFNSAVIGTFLHGMNSSFGRVTPVNVRHNFWDTTALLDGSYPAVLWQHQFVVYTEVSTTNAPLQFAKGFFNLADNFGGSAAPLLITYVNSPDLTYLNFGNCFLDDKPGLRSPEFLLQFQAGFIELSFLGTTKPT